MTKPVLFVVDDEPASLQALTRELDSRYGAHYLVVSADSVDAGLARLKQLRADGVDVPLILADQWMPGLTGTEFLTEARHLHPTARRGLLISWGDTSASAPILAAVALGQIEFYAPRPAFSPDEIFHRAVTEALEEWWRQRGGQFEAVTVIAADPSPRGHRIRDLLTRNNVPFGFLARDSAAGAEALDRLGLPPDVGPVVALYNGAVLVDPTNVEVAAALGADTRPADLTYDVIVVGAGPGGLAAAVYAASEGLVTGLLERVAFGGQAGTSSLIRNYIGFPRGVSGAELAWRAYEQAWLFGTHLVYGHPATALTREGHLYAVALEDESPIRARVVIVATGMSYRRLGVPTLEHLVGAGVFYGAATAEAQAVQGQRVFVVGGGNSAGQAALHLARYAAEVTMLIRSDSLAASTSDYLVRQIANVGNLHVRHGVEVVGGGGDGRLERLELQDRQSGRLETVPASALFVLIGAEPLTEWLPDTVGRDRWGFVRTGPDIAGPWTLDRPPYLLETRMPGVFAVGDVRHGSVKRVASAVGEGSIAVRMVHDYLGSMRP